MSSSGESYCHILDNLLLSADFGIGIEVNMALLEQRLERWCMKAIEDWSIDSDK